MLAASALPLSIGLLLLVSRGDVEALLGSTTGAKIPDAFSNVNSGAWTLLTVTTCQSLLAMVLIVQRKRLTFVPLYVGSVIGALVFVATFNAEDPHWFQLVTLISLGTFVSNLVVICLLLSSKRTSAPRSESGR